MTDRAPLTDETEELLRKMAVADALRALRLVLDERGMPA